MCKVEMTPGCSGSFTRPQLLPEPCATDGPLSAVKESIGKRLLCLADLSAKFFFIFLGFHGIKSNAKTTTTKVRFDAGKSCAF